MKRLVRAAIENSPAMNMLVIALLVLGTLSLIVMRREVFPRFELEIVLVTVPYPGASPAEVEQGICQKIEEAVQSIDGIKKLHSIAAEGSGSEGVGIFFECLCAFVVIVVDTTWEYFSGPDGVVAVGGGVGSVVGICSVYCGYSDGDVGVGYGAGGIATFFRS